MHKKRLRLFLFILSIASYQYSFAHGGGSGDSSYDFDKRDIAAERAAVNKAAEEKQDQNDWADFMSAVNSPKTKKGESSIEEHGHHGSADAE